ncbi:DUF433 domain-containing protein [Phenylobacterium sp.]|uniref:DUF433 domain-containing protein n=1 Tax=Phenylobacterium sp. TaxID=1871053 RepID=UPI0039831C65
MPHDRIDINPRVMAGKPVIKGTRIPVEHLVRECAHGPPEWVAEQYDGLTADDVRAALAYAADHLNANRPSHAAE